MLLDLIKIEQAKLLFMIRSVEISYGRSAKFQPSNNALLRPWICQS